MLMKHGFYKITIFKGLKRLKTIWKKKKINTHTHLKVKIYHDFSENFTGLKKKNVISNIKGVKKEKSI